MTVDLFAHPSWNSLKKYCPHRPHPKQAIFLQTRQREVFFGGAAGPGKTDALLMAALQFVEVPGYSALLLRRTFPQLNQKGSIMDRLRQWLANTDALWHGADHRFTFPSGASISFGHCDTDQDTYQYDSSEFQFIAFDELTSFSEWQYTYMFSRLRGPCCEVCVAGAGLSGNAPASSSPQHNPLGHITLRMRSASNPGNRGHDWVREFFMIGQPFEELKKRHPDRLYLPATLEDNPSLRREEYIENLNRLEPVRREQLLKGDWDVRPAGQLFNRVDFEIVDDYPREMVFVRSWDTAATKNGGDWTVGVLMGRTRQGICYICDVVRAQASPAEVENLMKQTAELDGRSVTVYLQEEPGSAGKAYIDHLSRDTLRGFSVMPERLTGDKYTRAKPFSSQVKAKNVKIKRAPWNREFLDELDAAGPDPSKYDHDDQWDAASSAFNYLCAHPMEFGWTSVKAYQRSPLYHPEDSPFRRNGYLIKSRRWGTGGF